MTWRATNLDVCKEESSGANVALRRSRWMHAQPHVWRTSSMMCSKRLSTEASAANGW
jgi:hypothetical protein